MEKKNGRKRGKANLQTQIGMNKETHKGKEGRGTGERKEGKGRKANLQIPYWHSFIRTTLLGDSKGKEERESQERKEKGKVMGRGGRKEGKANLQKTRLTQLNKETHQSPSPYQYNL